MRCYSLSRWHPEPGPLVTPPPLPARSWLYPSEAARYCGVSDRMMYEYACQPDGPVTFVLGKRRRKYDRYELDLWLERCRVQGRKISNAAASDQMDSPLTGQEAAMTG
jgi:hypothetical protein